MRDSVYSALPLLLLILPLGGVVFVGDGVLQGMREFKFEARLMGVATAAAGGAVGWLELGGAEGSTVQHVWAAFAVLQSVRAAGIWGKLWGRSGAK